MLNGDNATFTVDNGSVMINDANVTTADVAASNGIIHVIDKVLMPPADEPVLEDIATVATNTGVHDVHPRDGKIPSLKYGTNVAALAHAGLVATLQGEGPFTVFAPTDEAFAAAGIDLSTFDNDEANATLTDILTYHVYAVAPASTTRSSLSPQRPLTTTRPTPPSRTSSPTTSTPALSPQRTSPTAWWRPW